MHENLREGLDVFLQGGGKSFGAVRQVRKQDIVVYIENAGDFDVPFSAVQDVEAGKVFLDPMAIDARMQEAIRRAHAGEDPRIP